MRRLLVLAYPAILSIVLQGCGTESTPTPVLPTKLVGVAEKSTDPSIGTYHVIHFFTGGSDGSHPSGGLVQGASGDIFGMASGGSYNDGVVYEIDPTGNESIVHAFNGSDGNNNDPGASLIADGSGNIYGVTGAGGTSNAGVVFKIDAFGQYSLVYNFKGSEFGDGAIPSSIVRDSVGDLFGVTLRGGSADKGTIFKIDSQGNESILHSFKQGHVFSPTPNLVLAADGDLYVTALLGGQHGAGGVYKSDLNGDVTTMYSFSVANGYIPVPGLTFDSRGDLYGVTMFGGSFKYGVLWKIKPDGVESALYDFGNGNDGSTPGAGVVRDTWGNLYGTTTKGGEFSRGVLFKVTGVGQDKILHNFARAGGFESASPLLPGSPGTFFGTTLYGGLLQNGVVFEWTSR